MDGRLGQASARRDVHQPTMLDQRLHHVERLVDGTTARRCRPKWSATTCPSSPIDIEDVDDLNLAGHDRRIRCLDRPWPPQLVDTQRLWIAAALASRSRRFARRNAATICVRDSRAEVDDRFRQPAIRALVNGRAAKGGPVKLEGCPTEGGI